MKPSKIATYTALAVPAFYALVVLFGAPFLSHFQENFTLASLLAIYTALPLALSAQDESSFQELVFEGRAINSAQLYSHRLAAGALLGAWLGAVVIPLDWDRWWQKYPLPSLFGASVGALVGLVVAQLEVSFKPSKLKFLKQFKIV